MCLYFLPCPAVGSWGNSEQLGRFLKTQLIYHPRSAHSTLPRDNILSIFHGSRSFINVSFEAATFGWQFQEWEDSLCGFVCYHYHKFSINSLSVSQSWSQFKQLQQVWAVETQSILLGVSHCALPQRPYPSQKLYIVSNFVRLSSFQSQCLSCFTYPNQNIYPLSLSLSL